MLTECQERRKNGLQLLPTPPHARSRTLQKSPCFSADERDHDLKEGCRVLTRPWEKDAGCFHPTIFVFAAQRGFPTYSYRPPAPPCPPRSSQADLSLPLCVLSSLFECLVMRITRSHQIQSNPIQAMQKHSRAAPKTPQAPCIEYYPRRPASSPRLVETLAGPTPPRWRKVRFFSPRVRVIEARTLLIRRPAILVTVFRQVSQAVRCGFNVI